MKILVFYFISNEVNVTYVQTNMDKVIRKDNSRGK